MTAEGAGGRVYRPRPGTIPFRVLAWLETQEPRGEFSTAAIAYALEVNPNNVMPCLFAALEAGVLFRRQKDDSHPRSPFFWSLVDHGEGKRHPSVPIRGRRADPRKVRPDAATLEALEAIRGLDLSRATAAAISSDAERARKAQRAIEVAKPLEIDFTLDLGPSLAAPVPSALGRDEGARKYIERLEERGHPDKVLEEVRAHLEENRASELARIVRWTDGTIEIRRSDAPVALFTPVEVASFLAVLKRLGLLTP